MIKDLNAADIMTKKLITFTPDTQVLKAIDKLISYRISGAPVLDDNGNMIGMLSEIDCLSQ